MNIVNNYKECVGGIEFAPFCILDPNESVAWVGGDRYDHSADVDKIRTNARVEQIADAVKRVCDCASHPRGEHLPSELRLICSQGLFWLSEIADRNDMNDWLRGTRLFTEVAPSLSSEKYSPSLLPRLKIDANTRKAIVDWFVPIPAGVYEFGYKCKDVASEPPANLITSQMCEFAIMRHPVTNRQWNQIFESPRSEVSDHPVVNVNYFEARHCPVNWDLRNEAHLATS